MVSPDRWTDTPPASPTAARAENAWLRSYVVVGRSAVRSEEVPTRQAWQYAAITVVLFTSAEVLSSAAAFALSALVAQLFMSLKTYQAIALFMLPTRRCGGRPTASSRQPR
ncbi:hypothetical protein ACQPYK_22895 [Streptosporangium sp. CA-135522]|uniref:hypothetical protein n=1 Tax=Streptosporangium sp. CA-135522 TaxID=3240072 RepID=UPI003D8DD634